MLFVKEGIMTRIRVNTEELKNKAKDFDSASEALAKAGDEIAALAMAMPSYEGQLSNPARKIGYEIQKQTRELSANFAGDAESLRKTAKAFEDVDNKTQEILNENVAIMLNSPLIENDVVINPVGNDNLGYEDYDDYVIIKRNGERYKIYKNEQNQETIDKYENDIDQYYKDKAIFDALIKDLQSRSGSVYLAGLAIYVLIALGVVSIVVWPEIMLSLLTAGISAELIGRMIENATEIAAEIGHKAEEEISEAIAKIIDPLDPDPIIEDINKLKEINSAMNEDLSKIEQDIKELNLPELSPKPTPSPSETPTPSPSETPSPNPSETPAPTPSEKPTPTP
jgi:uncharacterized protein YukE